MLNLLKAAGFGPPLMYDLTDWLLFQPVTWYLPYGHCIDFADGHLSFYACVYKTFSLFLAVYRFQRAEITQIFLYLPQYLHFLTPLLLSDLKIASNLFAAIFLL